MRIRSSLAACSLSLAIGIQFAAADTFTVTNTTDGGSGSLRQAITDGNGHANIDPNTPDIINFAIPGAGLQTITPLSALPTITDPVVIDGYTQPGSSPNTVAVGDNSIHLIEINGNGARVNALTITAGNSTVRGLVINRFSPGNTNDNDITLQTNGGNKVEGCFLGLDAAGTAADPVSYFSNFGVVIRDSPNNTIGGTTPAARNVIAGRTNGISINNAASSGTTIQGNYIGINAAGTTAFLTDPSSGSVSFVGTGIQIGGGPGSGSSNNLIGGTAAGARNVISGTASHDILLFDETTTGNVIQGNYLGTNATGAASVFGTGNGITLFRTSSVTIGGGSVGAGNLISGNRGTGILISNDSGPSRTVGNTIQGNLIGTDPAGTAAVGNGNGIVINGGQNNTIGGTTAAARNIISGNIVHGIVIRDSANGVQGNFIGTDITGTAKVGNGGDGVVVSGLFGFIANGVTIGGTTAAARNIISGSGLNGVELGDASTTLIQGNFIGTDVNGTGNLGNTGIGISLNSVNNTIGGVTAGAGNVIAFNGTAPGRQDSQGVFVSGFSSGISILGNSIFSNAALGINLGGGSDVIANDPCDADTGANNLQNYPVITTVANTVGAVNITGTLNSTASTTFRLEFFRNDVIDPSGYGEGQVFLGFANVTTDGSCNATFNVNFPAASGAGHITATATDSNGNTSEFSAAIGQLLNISSRLQVQTGENVLIGGFIITGTDLKRVIVRGIGPSLTAFGVPGALADPTLELHGSGAFVTITNDNWRSDQQVEIEATGLPPTNDLESAIVQTLAPGSYTAIVRGKDNTTGVGVVEAYDLDTAANSKLANISTRGLVETGDNVLIGGFITGNGLTRVIIRAIGPTLVNFGITNPLLDPTLELHDGSGTAIATNDDWQTAQESEIIATGLPPGDPRESAIVSTLSPGSYTAVVRGKNNATGIAVVEVYNIP
jgi:hypothetical protein